MFTRINAKRLESRLRRVVADLDDCIARIVTAILIERRTGGGVTASDVTRLIRDRGDEALSKVLRGPSGPEDYRFKSIAEQLVEARATLKRIPSDRVAATRKLNGSTDAIYEDKLESARNDIENSTYGVLTHISDIANATYSIPSVTSLHLLYEIRGKSRIVLRRIRSLERPLRGFVLSYKPAVFLFVVSLIVAPVMYVKRASDNHQTPVATALKTQIDVDRSAFKAALDQPAKSGPERGIAAIGEVSNAVSTLPKALTAVSLLLGLVEYIFLGQRWRQRPISDLRGDLTAAAESVRKWLGEK
jgi:hypothetical protein